MGKIRKSRPNPNGVKAMLEARRLPSGESSCRMRYRMYIYNAKKRSMV